MKRSTKIPVPPDPVTQRAEYAKYQKKERARSRARAST